MKALVRICFWAICLIAPVAQGETPQGKALLEQCRQQGLSALQQADRSSLDADDQFALWSLAAQRNWPFATVQHLLPLDVVGPYGRTIAWPAAQYGRLEWLKALPSKLLNVMDEQNQTPLMQAAWSGQLAVMQWLATQGAALDGRNRSGWTPLHMALFNDQMDVVAWLLSQQVPVTGRTQRGWTVITLAISGGHCDLLPRLIQAGAPTDVPVQIGSRTYTPQELARALGADRCSQQLNATR